MCSEGLRERYVNPYTNFAFKLLFGTDLNKEILIGFLNALFDGKQVIEDVTYLNTEHLGSKEIDRRAVFDVYCENEKGEKIEIKAKDLFAQAICHEVDHLNGEVFVDKIIPGTLEMVTPEQTNERK